MLLREALLSDIVACVKLHKVNYPEGHATKHWPCRLLSAYFEAFKNSDNIFIVIEKDKEIIGYAIFGTDLHITLRAFKIENWFILILNYLGRPISLAKHIVIYCLSLFPKNTPKSVSLRTKDWVLLSICTNKTDQKIAESLMHEFERLGVINGSSEAQLYVKPSNARAVKFYTKSGYKINRSGLNNSDSYTMIKKLEK